MWTHVITNNYTAAKSDKSTHKDVYIHLLNHKTTIYIYVHIYIYIYMSTCGTWVYASSNKSKALVPRFVRVSLVCNHIEVLVKAGREQTYQLVVVHVSVITERKTYFTVLRTNTKTTQTLKHQNKH